jgi:hypothetical protein
MELNLVENNLSLIMRSRTTFREPLASVDEQLPSRRSPGQFPGRRQMRISGPEIESVGETTG